MSEMSGIATLARGVGKACRLLVSWRSPSAASYFAVGFLDQTASGEYEFAYFKRVTQLDGFRPLLGFPDLGRRYRSQKLFALFAERVMSPDRPDRPQWLERLGLQEDALPMEILARSGGVRHGDRLELTPVPVIDRESGATHAAFLVHGVRYFDGAQERIAQLVVGERLALVPKPENKINPRALLVTEDGKYELGWVPDPLLDYVHDVLESGPTLTLVKHANAATVDPHMQLVVEITGKLAPDRAPFSGADWVLAA